MKKIFIIIITVFFVFLILLITMLIVFTDNRTLDFEEFTIIHSQSDSSISIIHLSDLHFSSLRVDTEVMLEQIKEKGPDIIAITGDIVGTRTDILQSGVFEFIERVTQVAPVYFVSGNHENNNRDSRVLYDNMSANGVTILNNQSVIGQINGINIIIAGLQYGSCSVTINSASEAIKDSFVLLLTHKPKWGTVYAYYGGARARITPNLILSGHIHGGQIRVFGRGLLCPDTFLFPRYASGLYTSDGAQMIVSRGIGNSVIPWRINNRPHIPIITLFGHSEN